MGKMITLADGRTIEAECLSCALTSGQIELHGGTIAETEYFHAHQVGRIAASRLAACTRGAE
ncbi:hypothetical protein ABEX25_18270 [Paenibacillus thiaminolyticus]|uniref:hypothetical protein n=1 Tax=Paenibacillus thiaminolyticus TaxID=49283 RepID=UPI003D2AC566